MAKRRASRRTKPARPARKRTAARRSVQRPIKKAQPRRQEGSRSKADPQEAVTPTRKKTRARKAVTKTPRLDRVRRTLDETVPTPSLSLDMDRRESAARTGRAGLENSLREHGGTSRAITGGDVDADWENTYFSGDEAPGGDNPTPDQEVVDDIGKALAIEYQAGEELKSSDKVVEGDKHRWELDPASSEDY